MACWLLGVGALVETKWFYEMITMTMVVTGNVQLTSAENEYQSELVLFFEDSKMTRPTKKVSLLTGLSLRMAVTALQRLRDIFSPRIVHENVKLGGRGKTVEIDEFMFGHKRKYNRGRIGRGAFMITKKNLTSQ